MEDRKQQAKIEALKNIASLLTSIINLSALFIAALAAFSTMFKERFSDTYYFWGVIIILLVFVIAIAICLHFVISKMIFQTSNNESKNMEDSEVSKKQTSFLLDNKTWLFIPFFVLLFIALLLFITPFIGLVAQG